LDGALFSALYQPELELPGEVARNFEFCQIATNNFGCQDTTCRWVYMDSAYLMWVPNAFTPDGDAINDVFFVTMMGFDEASYSLQVFDRWGVEVFRSNDPQEVWVGDHQGGQYYCQPDTYAWIVSVKKKDSAEYETFRGHITLIR
jgi:gliding motility-associated-like protein